MTITGVASMPDNPARLAPGRLKRKATIPLVAARDATNENLTQNIGSSNAELKSGRKPSIAAIIRAAPSVPTTSPVT